MNRSTNFNFYLPTNADPMLVSDLTYNFETIDAQIAPKSNTVLLSAQNLTDAQKSQVRQNIGAEIEILQDVSTEYNYLKVARIGHMYIVIYTRKKYTANASEVYSMDSRYAPNTTQSAWTFCQQESGYSAIQCQLSTSGIFGLYASEFNEPCMGSFTFIYTK